MHGAVPFGQRVSISFTEDDPFTIVWWRTPPMVGRLVAVDTHTADKLCAMALVYYDMAIRAECHHDFKLRCFLYTVTFPFVLPIRGVR